MVTEQNSIYVSFINKNQQDSKHLRISYLPGKFKIVKNKCMS